MKTAHKIESTDLSVTISYNISHKNTILRLKMYTRLYTKREVKNRRNSQLLCNNLLQHFWRTLDGNKNITVEYKNEKPLM